MNKQNGFDLSCGKAGCCIVVFPDNELYDSPIHHVLKATTRGQRHDTKFVLFTLSAIVGAIRNNTPDTNKPA